MGRVYEGWHRALGMCVALKVIDPALMGNLQARARFEKEALTLAKLQEPVPHPNIVRILDFKLLEDVGCIVMAFVAGVDLKTWSQTRQLTVRQTAAVVAQVARAAGYIHSCGVVHRDLKPGNILVREEDQEPVIVDFGIVRGGEDVTLTLTQQALGTAAYMAPEVLKPTGQPSGPRADVYALGVILYELLTARLPHGATLSEVLQRHEQEMPAARPTQLAPGLPKDLERVCLKAMATRQGDRYSNGSELAEDLQRFLDGHSVTARPIGRVVLMGRTMRRRPLISAGIAAVTTVALFGMWRLEHQAREVRQTRLLQQISESLAVQDWSAAHLEAVRQQILLSAKLDHEKAAEYQTRLIAKAGQGVSSAASQARLPEEHLQAMQETIDWLRTISPTESDRLQALLRERQRQWTARAALKSPFENLREFNLEEKVDVIKDWLVPRQAAEVSFSLGLGYRAPLELELTLRPEIEGFKWCGVSAKNGEGSLDFRVYQPLNDRLRRHLDFMTPPGTPMTGALVISSGREILAAIPLWETLHAGRPVIFRARLQERRWMVSVNDRSVEYLSPYTIRSPWKWSVEQSVRTPIGSITLRRPNLPALQSPLERGDELVLTRQWAEAEQEFLQLVVDPVFGAEALFKAGDCQARQSLVSQAIQTWRAALPLPPSEWRERSVFQLWRHHVSEEKVEEANKLLDQLPRENPLPPYLLASINPQARETLADRYRSMKRGIKLVQNDPEAASAVRVYQMLDIGPLPTATHLALGQHCNGLDQTALELCETGLRKTHTSVLLNESLPEANSCMEVWSLLVGPEPNRALRSAAGRITTVTPEGHSLRWTVAMDQARLLARKGDKERAAILARQVQFAENATIMAYSGAALLLHAIGEDASLEHVNAALRRIPSSPRQVHELTVIHRVLLHAAARDFTKANAAELIAAYFSFGFSRHSRPAVSAQLGRQFLQDPALARALNSFLDDGKGREVLEGFALRSRPARELIREFLLMLLRNHLAASLYEAGAADVDLPVCAMFAEEWLEAYASAKLNDVQFFSLMGALEKWRLGSRIDRERLSLPPELLSKLEQLLEEATAAEADAGS
jgi:serine/threonine protein kinase/tetratricopeptide (TPR) repeat protein